MSSDVFVSPSAAAPEAEEKNTTTVTVESRPSEHVTASEAAAASTDPQSQDPAATDAGETRRRSGTPYSQRIGELTREKYELRSKIQELESRLHGAPSPTPDAPRTDQPPRLDAFESYEQWVEAVADYRAEKRFRDLQRQDEERQVQERERLAAVERRTTYETNVAKAEQRYSDYHDVTAEMPVTPTMAAFLMGHDKGPDIAYYLGRSPDEAMRIALLDPVKQGYELARLEAKLATPQQSAKAVTSAPEPINPVRPRASTPSGDPAKMTMGEYAVWRKKQMREQRGR